MIQGGSCRGQRDHEVVFIILFFQDKGGLDMVNY